MTTHAKMDDALREAIIQTPDVILDDPDVMMALIAANERMMGDNIVDLRGIAMERMETRLDRLQDTHRSVIAAAYDNLAGTNQVHRAVLRLLEPTRFDEFLEVLQTDIAETLRVSTIRLVLESDKTDAIPDLPTLADAITVAAPDYIDAYLTQGRARTFHKRVTLRSVQAGSTFLFGSQADWIRSEACLTLDLGHGRRPGLLVLGSEDPHMFSPQQGTDLLEFFADAFARLMQRWLA